MGNEGQYEIRQAICIDENKVWTLDSHLCHSSQLQHQLLCTCTPFYVILNGCGIRTLQSLEEFGQVCHRDRHAGHSSISAWQSSGRYSTSALGILNV